MKSQIGNLKLPGVRWTPVCVHRSQFPDRTREELAASLRGGEVDPKFHYQSVKQCRQWFELHQACSPVWTSPDGAAIYRAAEPSVLDHFSKASSVALIGLGCGGGRKDRPFLQAIRSGGSQVSYWPVDASLPMVLDACSMAAELVPDASCHPVLCGLSRLDNWHDLAASLDRRAPRLITCFGLLPNLYPQPAFAGVRAMVRNGDLILLSANLIPGPGSAEGLGRILPLYDNELTRRWLMTFILDLGVEPGDGELRFGLEPALDGGLPPRIVTVFDFARDREIWVDDQCVPMTGGTSLRLFYSFRYTRESIGSWLHRQGLEQIKDWITESGEEGVFLCRVRNDSSP